MPNQFPPESDHQNIQADNYQLNGKGMRPSGERPTDTDEEKLQGYQNQTKRLLFTLLAIGLVAGAVFSAVIIGAMQRFDLLDNQPQIEQRG